jgi:predicted nucleotide-binding protein
VTRFCVGYLDPLLQELREHSGELFARIDKATGGRVSSIHRSEVFIVHGHNHKFRREVAEFLLRILGKPATILDEQPNKNLTVIEKLERCAAKACFAVVLYTADDPRTRMESMLRRKHPERVPRRPRPNVLFELGYFCAKLDRSNVVLLYDNKLELPSDLSGVLYRLVNSTGAWKIGLAQEMRAAGIDIDLSKAL